MTNRQNDRDLGRRLLVESLGDGVLDAPEVDQFVIKPGKHCRHAQVLVCTEQRRVECGTCGAVLDPFDVVHGFASKERHFRQWEKEALDEAAKVERLKKEEKRIKARLGTARTRLPPEAPVDGELLALRKLEEAVRAGHVSSRVHKALVAIDELRKRAPT
jgi:hypothetical protein